MYRADRSSKGGGSAIFVSNLIYSIPVKIPKVPSIDIVGIDFFSNNLKTSTRLLNIYIPPNTSTILLQELCITLSKFVTDGHKILITGDFNFHVNCHMWDYINQSRNICPKFSLTLQEQIFLEFCINSELIQYVTQPTRLDSIFDLILSDAPLKNVKISAPFFSSDHNTISFNYNITIDNIVPKKILSFEKCNFLQIISIFNNIN